MALFKPYKCTEGQLSSLPIKEGQLIFTTDTGKVYLDVSSTSRMRLYSEALDKLDSVEENANHYELPIASTKLGGVRTDSTITDLSEYISAPITKDGTIYIKNSPTITEFNQNTAVFRRGGNLNVPIVTGTRVRISETEPSDIDMNEGDIWMVLEKDAD